MATEKQGTGFDPGAAGYELQGRESSPSAFDTIVQAEASLTSSGYVRDSQRHVWVKDGKAAKVVRTLGNKFILQRA